MSKRTGIFVGDDPFALARAWLDEAAKTEPNDPNAIALATVDADGLPDVRMVLLKEIEAASFLFYTNYDSAKGRQLAATGVAAFVMHWKSLRRQIRVRGTATREDGVIADAYYNSRPLPSRIGAWASRQSEPLESREALLAETARLTALHEGVPPPRPPFWGGIRITPVQIEFWADGEYRLHDRFRWMKTGDQWQIDRLNP